MSEQPKQPDNSPQEEQVTENKKKQTPWGLYIGIVLLVLGISLVAYNPIMSNFVQPKVLESEHTKTFEQVGKDQIAKNKQKADKEATYDFGEVELLTTSLANVNPKINPDIVAGEIMIPAVDLHLPIVYGTTNENLLFASTTMKKGQKMGEGNYALAGHNAKNQTVLFAPLHRVKNGQKIYITDKDKIYTYVIDDIGVVEPTEVQVIEDVKGDKRITLVTCEDDEGKTRLIVGGTLESVDTFKAGMQLPAK